MTEQKVATETAEAAEKVEPKAETPTPETTRAAASAPEPVTQPAPVAAAKRTAPAEPASKPAKAAKAEPVRKPVKAARAKPVRKPVKAANARPARKPAVNQTRPPAVAGARQIEGVKTMTRKTNGIESGLFAAEQFKTVFGDVNERAKAAVERSAKIVEELADLTRGNVEALVASSKVAAKGVETLSQDAAEYSRKSFEEASAALKGFAEVKSATDFFKLQSDFARSAFDSAVAETARLSETMLKFAGDVAEPITSRYTVAAERVKTLAA